MDAVVTTKYVCGIDLHARTLSLCIMDKNGKIHLRKSIKCILGELMTVLEPYLKSITVGVESTFNWYWLIDGLRKFKVVCHLGHALYIKRLSGKKHKNDPVDARSIAELLRVNRFPLAYAYPHEMRATRDLLRRRHFFVRRRAGTFTHLQNTFTANGYIESYKNCVHRKSDRRELVHIPKNTSLQKILSSDIDYVESLDRIIEDLEKTITIKAIDHNRAHYKLLLTIPGCGAITALTILYETHTIKRFRTAQDYSSYSRVVSADNESGGTSYGHTSNDKIGNPYLKWALSEIGTRIGGQSEPIQQWYDKQESQHGAGGVQARLRHKLAVAIHYMLTNNTVFDEYKFLGIQKDRAETTLKNGTETSGQTSDPSIRNGKPSGRLNIKKAYTVKKEVVKSKPGRSSLRTTGNGKVSIKRRTLAR